MTNHHITAQKIEGVTFFHPLSMECDGTFDTAISDDTRSALESRLDGGVYDPAYVLDGYTKALGDMIGRSQMAEIRHLHPLGLAEAVDYVHEKPVEAAKENYVKKVTNAEKVGEGVLWIGERVLAACGQHKNSTLRNTMAVKSPFEAGGTFNNGTLSSTDALDALIDIFPDMLKSAGAEIVSLKRHSRRDPETILRHRVWPIDTHPAASVAFYQGESGPEFLNVRRRRSFVDVILRFGKQRILLEGYKEAFAQAIPAELTGETRKRYDKALETTTVADLLSRQSAVADILGEEFTRVIDSRDDATRAIIPNYTCMMFRFTDPYREPGSIRTML